MSTVQTVTHPALFMVFFGEIKQESAARIATTIVNAHNNGYVSMHLMLQSFGGVIGDCISLHNFFRTVTNIDLTIYNTGAVESGAVLAYVGAEKRKCSASAAFIIHRGRNSPQFATADRLQDIAEALRVDDDRMESILRSRHISLPEDRWAAFRNGHDVFITSQEAKAIGLADEITDFAPTSGSHLVMV